MALKLRRTPFALRAEVDKQIKDMEQRGVIEKSTSPYSSHTDSAQIFEL